uniref:C2H2-type domain-containing protein n=1 Tax=Heterorhabditis bacteriophora TaxID=37862 RepID=A0A1I7XQF4_HETBA
MDEIDIEEASMKGKRSWKPQCSFSIDNLLKLPPEADDNQHSTSPRSDVTVYTLDALEVSDGRAKSTKKYTSSRCVCDQCGKSYATTSNLSRHKQTHRPLDSEHAKQCPHCERIYVSMPALRVIFVHIPGNDLSDALTVAKVSLIGAI